MEGALGVAETDLILTQWIVMLTDWMTCTGWTYLEEPKAMTKMLGAARLVLTARHLAGMLRELSVLDSIATIRAYEHVHRLPLN